MIFDGTLFFKEGFHQEDIEAIKTFQSKGNKFALCTGRPLGGVNALMKGKNYSRLLCVVYWKSCFR